MNTTDEDLSCPRCGNDDDRRFHCPHCCQEFDGPRYLSAHIIREHR
jgi:uncharacterized membrane protein YvbJ